jgi:hypothetical protein
MSNYSHKQTYLYRVSIYVRSHKGSLGLFLAAYGAFYLTAVLLSGWTIADWGKDITGYPPSPMPTLLPRSFINPIFFVTSLPTLLVGAAMLCIYSLQGISPKVTLDKQYVAILLTAFGFIYQVIGAWPLGDINVFPWDWQKQIVLDGPIFAWTLYILSLLVLAVGVFSLYMHSRFYHQKHFGEDETNVE